MIPTRLQSEIAKSKDDLRALAERIGPAPESVSEVLAGLRSDQARIRYGCLKMLRLLSERQPAVVYPHFETIAALLDSDRTILKWGAILIMGHLAAVDSENRIDAMLEDYLRPVSGPVLITAANTIQGAGEIARAKPYLADRVVRAFLEVEQAKYETPECRNVALGHVLKSMGRLFHHVKDPRPVIDFAKRQLSNRRSAVQKEARAFLKRHGKPD
ncbi:MAG: hypothetical protein H7A46_06200 [Verrucomicrobiales bacterium]|nr:hypothetical protein [Verrucomicrobiales bacterium]